MGQVKTHLLHAFDHRSRWRSARHHGLDAGGHARLHGGRGIDQQAVHDGRTAVMRDAVVAHGVEHGLGVHLAQAHVHARTRRHCPRKAPAIAMEHGQRPHVDRVLGHVPFQNVRDRIGGCAPVVVDHTLRVAGGAAGVIQSNRVPLVGGQAPGKVAVSAGHKGFIGHRTQFFGRAGVERVFHIDHQQWPAGLAQRQRFFHHARKLRVHDHRLRLAVVQHESHRLRVQPGVQGIEHGPDHGDAEVRLHHGRCVGQHHGHCVVLANARQRQRTGQLAGAAVGGGPVLAQIAVHDGQACRVNLGRALNEAQRRHRRVVGGGLGQILIEDADFGFCHRCSVKAGCPMVNSLPEPAQKSMLVCPETSLWACRDGGS